ncbi:hypothetical protein HNQ08_004484 [Deinococcus humi]|uniref:Uncharacterized protein n=1 Tax=Deinococcus humi TaxID=662880 RepID=A0A7W8JYW6_9DEIO|nr:hypothetical protein [Deinococcus humi]GGO36165.1 hypothetical protein GCM10008949_39670 [Deinococcus humi]
MPDKSPAHKQKVSSSTEIELALGSTKTTLEPDGTMHWNCVSRQLDLAVSTLKNGRPIRRSSVCPRARRVPGGGEDASAHLQRLRRLPEISAYDTADADDWLYAGLSSPEPPLLNPHQLSPRGAGRPEQGNGPTPQAPAGREISPASPSGWRFSPALSPPVLANAQRRSRPLPEGRLTRGPSDNGLEILAAAGPM